MRIGVVTTSYPRQEDDPAGTFVAEHVAWLCRRGHEVDVVCAADAARAHEPWQPGVSITPVPAPAGLFYAGGAPEAFDRMFGHAFGHAFGRMFGHAFSRASSYAAGTAPAVDSGMWGPAPADTAGDTVGFWHMARFSAGAMRFSAALTAAVARRARQWDCIFAHWLLPSAAAAALVPTRTPLVAIAHSGDVHLCRRLGLIAPLAALLARRNTSIAFVSHDLRQAFLAGVRSPSVRSRLGQTSMISPMGVDTARFRAIRAKRMERASRAGSHEPMTVLFMGRLVPIKGVDTLLGAMRLLERHHAGPSADPWRLVIAGDGPARPALEQRARTLAVPVMFEGEVRGAERDRLLVEADVLVVPSTPVALQRREGMPVTVFEAMAAGVPVIASRTGGLSELPASTAVLVPPGDEAALAGAIRHCHEDRAARAHQIDAALAHVERLDWQHVGARLFDCLGLSTAPITS